jgi:hypothetical protein
MTGERPHFGPVDPLWDFLPAFHRYEARVGYVLSCGQPVIDVALYYPVRDIWATGNPSSPALRGHDRLASALLDRQCDFDLIDDDVLSASPEIRDGRITIGSMRYRTIVVGPAEWMQASSVRRLHEFEAAGGTVIRVDDLAQVETAAARALPTVVIEPSASGIRVQRRQWRGGGALFVFNEGMDTYRGRVSMALEGTLYEVDPATGLVHRVVIVREPNGARFVSLSLDPGESLLLVADTEGEPGALAPPIAREFGDSIPLDDGWEARVVRQYRVREHDFEVESPTGREYRPTQLGPWATALRLGEDFSGHVSYRRTVELPASFVGKRLVLDLGALEYASRVLVDEKEIGFVLWNPFRIQLPAEAAKKTFSLRVDVANTLANELISSRVVDTLKKRTGPGWPSPYHARALAFERDSRRGGLLGPVRLRRLIGAD